LGGRCCPIDPTDTLDALDALEALDALDELDALDARGGRAARPRALKFLAAGAENLAGNRRNRSCSCQLTSHPHQARHA
jgi:hypothetical protein